MLVRRRLPLSFVLRFAVPVGVASGTWAALVFAAYALGGWGFLRVPFLPLSVMGTAVAFYVGFKNNASYERFWEGRKIWGGIVNASRTWANATCAYVDPGSSSDESIAQRRELIYRQLAWINALRMQLRRTTRFHDKPSGPTKRRLIKHADAMRNDWNKELAPFLSAQELELTTEQVNAATQLLARQGNQLAELVQSGRLDMFRQLALMEVVQELYALQGQSERIKNTPFSRHYAEYSRIFVYVFAFLVPLGMLDVFAPVFDVASDAAGVFAAVGPMIGASALVTWVFYTMEGIGDATEDPFERSMSDVPMNALCRTIEIDLREMLGETDLPEKEPVVDGLLY